MIKYPGILSPFLIVLVALVQSYCCENEDIHPDADTAANADAQADTESEFANFKDPGKGEWELGTPEHCKMDPTRFNKSLIPSFVVNYAVFRYGKLCHIESEDVVRDTTSSTMTFGAAMVGRAAYLARDIPRSGPGTGPIAHTDLGTDWIATPSYFNRNATVSHIMAMLAGSTSNIDQGDLTFEYDMYGNLAINDMISATEKCISQIPELPKDAESFVQQEIFDRMGMTSSSWKREYTRDEVMRLIEELDLISFAGMEDSPDFVDQVIDSVDRTCGIAAGWRANLSDMGKLGSLLLHDGWYGNERLLSQEWVYRMSHPAFESVNTGYGHLTWVNHRGNTAPLFSGLPESVFPAFFSQGDLCAPAAFWSRYPHPPSEAQDCMATFDGASCTQKYDVGVYYAFGSTEISGTGMIVMHPGLDMVIAAQVNNESQSYAFGPNNLWEAIRPGVVAMDPNYNGDEEAFCRDYGAGNYAPDLVTSRWQP